MASATSASVTSWARRGPAGYSAGSPNYTMLPPLQTLVCGWGFSILRSMNTFWGYKTGFKVQGQGCVSRSTIASQGRTAGCSLVFQGRGVLGQGQQPWMRVYCAVGPSHRLLAARIDSTALSEVYRGEGRSATARSATRVARSLWTKRGATNTAFHEDTAFESPEPIAPTDSISSKSAFFTRTPRGSDESVSKRRVSVCARTRFPCNC